MFDFDQGQQVLSDYGGAERKVAVLFGGAKYMLKYPKTARVQKAIGSIIYKNNHFSEYIGSAIFRSVGISAQDAVLGYYTVTSGKRKLVVGCRDFREPGDTLYEFKSLANSVDSESFDHESDETIEYVQEVIEEHELNYQ